MLSSFAFIMHLYETEKRYVRNDVGPMVPGAYGKNPPHYGQ